MQSALAIFLGIWNQEVWNLEPALTIFLGIRNLEPAIRTHHISWNLEFGLEEFLGIFLFLQLFLLKVAYVLVVGVRVLG